MTANQINYVKHLEDVRSHKANEEIAARQATASEQSASASLHQASSAARNAETNVLNADTNRISAEAAQMSASASQAMAAASLMNAETERMYKEAQILMEQMKQSENVRHNQATEQKDLLSLGETKRHNTQSEWISQFDITTKSGIAAADRAEKAREADMSADVTKRGQNFNLGSSLANTVVHGITSLANTGASLLKPFKSGFNAGKLTQGG